MRASLNVLAGASTAVQLVSANAHAQNEPQDSAVQNGPRFTPCSPSTFEPILAEVASGSTVNLTLTVSANGNFTDPTPGGNPANGGNPYSVAALPATCVAKFTVPSSDSSSFDFALFLPDEWNNRFMATGNGGFGGFIAWPDMARYSHYGFAAMSTNTGHYSSAFDASWGLNHPESQRDWGYRAMHRSTVISKQLIRAYYGNESQFNYYSGCSTGGRQGLKEVTMFPEDFDGVVVGAPAWWTTHLQPWSYQIGIANLNADSPSHVSNNLFTAVVDEIVRQCDPQDGVADGIVTDPYSCHFVPEPLLCNGTAGSTNSNSCLTPPQLGTLYKILNDWVDVNQTFVFPRLALGANPSSLAGVTDQPSQIGLTYLENFLLNNTDYDYHDFSYNVVQLADQIDPGQANASYEVEAFRAKGGKLLHYHGLSDPLISTGSSTYYHSQVQQSLASQGLPIDDFYRLFLIPGMQHCAGTAQGAPWYIAAPNQEVDGAVYSVPGSMDAKHDVTRAIMTWTENGNAPDYIVGTKYNNDNVTNGMQVQRPICAYPQQPVYSGSGNVSLPENWSCRGLS
ncbi:MAG: hypothetical protein Q9159_001773 [Coniocarpon cinnabarinum]